jgi:hypothetical protein
VPEREAECGAGERGRVRCRRERQSAVPEREAECRCRRERQSAVPETEAGPVPEAGGGRCRSLLQVGRPLHRVRESQDGLVITPARLRWCGRPNG